VLFSIGFSEIGLNSDKDLIHPPLLALRKPIESTVEPLFFESEKLDDGYGVSVFKL